MFRSLLPLLCVLAVLTLGCGSKSPTPRSVQGEVTVNKTPLADGEVFFILEGRPPQIATVKDGKFSGQAFEGKNRVEIRGYRPARPVVMDGKVINEGSKENYLPSRYNTESTLKEDVTASGPNEFKFAITK